MSGPILVFLFNLAWLFKPPLQEVNTGKISLDDSSDGTFAVCWVLIKMTILSDWRYYCLAEIFGQLFRFFGGM